MIVRKEITVSLTDDERCFMSAFDDVSITVLLSKLTIFVVPIGRVTQLVL